ncbi:ABC transporter ATP-binding protein [Mechercharimyces sp. CAU 1602]|uniref:ABC transporter ATP-binding protein n=1 Tax=Mechercharimyces sp. CAU 1602 TaxID=2973933 RepID=UPI00216182DE|nr:ABC transporter ATP-binding protein [Mechercharimyces sp. CAU 1602]MCS1350854.1 ABC transporter ATP-binding protein [Mechercharimyces sp. CAU 1602]
MGKIETIGLHKSYGEREAKVCALSDVNLKIEQGEFVAVVGASGSGKSTLLHMLGGLDHPTSGQVRVSGTLLNQLNEDELAIFRRRQVGFIFQFYNLIPILDVEENIRLPLLLDHKWKDKPYIDELMELLGLMERKHHLPSQLSGGQQQRVAIGRALAYKPAILLADEPTGNLDTKSTDEVMELLHLTSQRYNQTVILITHDLDIASQTERVLTMQDGMIVQDEVMRG